jgi:hypothetical protein
MVTSKKIFALILFSIVLVVSCKKKDQKNVPTLTTTAATNVTATGLTSGGTISSNGGETISATGLAYSKTNNMPTITDDTTKATVLSGTFISELKNLDPSSTYYIRAYATNSVGTGYGNVITISSGNAAPEARNISISGNANVGSVLRASYTYFDFENNLQSGTSFQWYRANDATGAGEAAIAGATDTNYIISDADNQKYLRVGVTAKSSAGTASGAEVKSSFTAGIGAQTEVSFYYNNKLVTYGIITSNVTGRKWLDRNLGAANMATAFNDWANYGDLFQWGRRADGHQLITRTTGDIIEDAIGFPISPSGASVVGTPFPWDPNPVNSPGWIDSDTPPHANFILVHDALAENAPVDWRKPQNDNLWQGVNGINNPCPSGWRIPTKDEFAAESVTDVTDGYNKLKLPYTHTRISNSLFVAPNIGRYWTATTADAQAGGGRQSYFFRIGQYFQTGTFIGNGAQRATANALRCIKN